jgi:hypothetical protein
MMEIAAITVIELTITIAFILRLISIKEYFKAIAVLHYGTALTLLVGLQRSIDALFGWLGDSLMLIKQGLSVDSGSGLREVLQSRPYFILLIFIELFR